MRIYNLIRTLTVIGAIIALTGASSAIAAPTGGSGGAMTNSTNQSYTGSKYTSKYHLYASGLDWSKPVGMLIYADGSAEYGLKNLNSSYLMAGTDGLINVAKRNNMILLTPLSPNTNCADGDGSCWYMGDSVGYAKWAEELVKHIQGRYNIDKDRVAFGGYSSGAQLATEWWVPSGAAQRTMTDGVIVAISYGGEPKMAEVSYDGNFKSKVHLNWNVGSKDQAYTGDGNYDAKSGYDAYTSKGFATSLDLVSGLGHSREDFGKVMEAQIKKHVPAGNATSEPIPNPVPPVNGGANCPAAGSVIGTITKDIQIANSGAYTIWSRMMKSGSSDKFIMQASSGGACAEIKGVNIPDNQWVWVNYQSGKTSQINSFDLKSGTNKISLIGVQPGVKIDRVMVVAAGSCQSGPVGNGDNCLAVIDTTPPSLEVSSPSNNSIVSGKTDIAVYAKDETSDTKVEILIDNKLVTELTPSPNSKYSWDTSLVQNGGHRLTIRAIDASGNTSTETRAVTVQNGDVEKPTSPPRFTAKVEAGKVILNWGASTDNKGVTGYVIYRNDNKTFTSTSQTYTDSSVLPGISYSYYITAKDAAGNISDKSSDVMVTVPKAEDTDAPSKPNDLKINATSSTQVSLTWAASTDNVAVAGYDVYRSVASDAFVKVATTSNPSYGEGSLQPSTKYAYYVVAKDTNGNVSSQSETAQVTTPSNTTTPTVPGNDDPVTPIDQTGIIRGKVRSNSTSSIAGVKVTATSHGKKYSALTNNDGVYRLENVPAGRYSLTFTHEQYRQSHESVRVRPDRETVVNERLTAKSSSSKPWWRRWWR